jgi:hypothetical protein
MENYSAMVKHGAQSDFCFASPLVRRSKIFTLEDQKRFNPSVNRRTEVEKNRPLKTILSQVVHYFQS